MSGYDDAIMPEKTTRHNRGPAGAANNRKALLRAARVVYARDGIRAPHSAVAKEAGLSQGVLYRHFPTRAALAIGLFSKNLTALAELAETHRGEDDCFLRLWRTLVAQNLSSLSFIEAVLDAGELPGWDGEARLLSVLTDPLTRASAAGLVDPDLLPMDIVTLLRACYGVLRTAPSPELGMASVGRLLALVGRGLELA